jgi:hypothetical protein
MKIKFQICGNCMFVKCNCLDSICFLFSTFQLVKDSMFPSKFGKIFTAKKTPAIYRCLIL